MRIKKTAPLVPTLRVGTHAPDALRRLRRTDDGTQSVQTCVPTRSVGTRNIAPLVPTLRVGTHAPDALRRLRRTDDRTQSVQTCVPTRSVGTRNIAPLVPTLRVGTHAPDALRRVRRTDDGTQSVQTCVPTRSVGTRKAFTLIELMVAMALTIFVMTILTQAFVLSIDTFTGFKGIGDMQENLRAGSNALSYDLSQCHFEGAVRTSDPTMATVRPREGFVRIYQQAPYSPAPEGVDGDNMPSSRANPALNNANVLHMACRLKGNQQQSFYTTQVSDGSGIFFNTQTFYDLNPALNPQAPADATLAVYPIPTTNLGFFRSQWAEIAYFLVPQGSTEEPLIVGGAGTPLFGLYRAQFVVVTDATKVNGQIQNSFASGFTGIAGAPTAPTITFYTPNTLATGAATRTFNPANPPAPPQSFMSLVVPNVLSFQVQDILQGAATPIDLNYDSALASPSTPNPNLAGVYITLRVWDNKTRQTRQMSIIKDL